VARRTRLGALAALVMSVLVAAACAVPPDVSLPVDPAPIGLGDVGPQQGAGIPDEAPRNLSARPSPGCATAAGGPFDGVKKLTVDNTPREFLLHVPAQLPSTPVSLVLSLHGLGYANGLQQGMTGWNDLAERDGFVVAYPQGVNNLWNFVPDDANTDIKYLRALVTSIQAERCIDLNRTYAGGISMGALTSAALACRAADVFAAFSLVSGIQLKPECAASPARPAVVFWGSKDCVLPYFGGMGPCLAIARQEHGLPPGGGGAGRLGGAQRLLAPAAGRRGEPHHHSPGLPQVPVRGVGRVLLHRGRRPHVAGFEAAGRGRGQHAQPQHQRRVDHERDRRHRAQLGVLPAAPAHSLTAHPLTAPAVKPATNRSRKALNSTATGRATTTVAACRVCQ
jgi:predicted esterase